MRCVATGNAAERPDAGWACAKPALVCGQVRAKRQTPCGGGRARLTLIATRAQMDGAVRTVLTAVEYSVQRCISARRRFWPEAVSV